MTIKKQKFTKEFKLQALHLASQPDTCIAQLARDLGIRRNMIYEWRDILNIKKDKAFKRTADNTITPHHKATHGELLKSNKQLAKDLKLAQMEVEILKKAQAFFKAQNS
jgi:transposase